MGIHYVAGAVLLIVADIAIARLFGLNLGMWIVQAIWHLPIVLRVITIILGGLIFVVVGLWLLGELVVHGIMQNAVKGIMAILEAIDRSTLKGTTGIIGFALIFLGFLGQLIGTIAGAH
jgi:hypothetical protein